MLDARLSAEAGADAIGLNFYAASRRCVAPAEAEAIVQSLPPQVVKVGLFVNQDVKTIRQAAARYQLDLLQLHGDEPPELLVELAGMPTMRAFRLAHDRLGELLAYLERCRQLDALPEYVLLDAAVPGQYGGTGKLADWTLAQAYCAHQPGPRLVLAGGLTAENVAAAVNEVHPHAVDTSSGVEAAPGIKDADRLKSFVAAARQAMR